MKAQWEKIDGKNGIVPKIGDLIRRRTMKDNEIFLEMLLIITQYNENAIEAMIINHTMPKVKGIIGKRMRWDASQPDATEGFYGPFYNIHRQINE